MFKASIDVNTDNNEKVLSNNWKRWCLWFLGWYTAVILAVPVSLEP